MVSSTARVGLPGTGSRSRSAVRGCSGSGTTFVFPPRSLLPVSPDEIVSVHLASAARRTAGHCRMGDHQVRLAAGAAAAARRVDTARTRHGGGVDRRALLA